MTAPSTGTNIAGGLDRFRNDLDATVVDEVARWADQAELGKLYTSLQAIHDQEKFLNTYAEAMVARYLLARECELRVEVLTPVGRTCDFEVIHGGQKFFLHVKRLNTDRAVSKHLTVSSRLRYLERIARPYVVSVRLPEDLGDEKMQLFVTSAAEFIQRARIGDELVIRDDDGAEIGGCRIVAWSSRRIKRMHLTDPACHAPGKSATLQQAALPRRLASSTAAFASYTGYTQAQGWRR